jgi:hypothetical protein
LPRVEIALIASCTSSASASERLAVASTLTQRLTVGDAPRAERVIEVVFGVAGPT